MVALWSIRVFLNANQAAALDDAIEVRGAPVDFRSLDRACSPVEGIARRDRESTAPWHRLHTNDAGVRQRESVPHLDVPWDHQPVAALEPRAIRNHGLQAGARSVELEASVVRGEVPDSAAAHRGHPPRSSLSTRVTVARSADASSRSTAK